ncbi:hypothetical protein NUM3379_14990 [Kineococcus sp. NUM-3379]
MRVHLGAAATGPSRAADLRARRLHLGHDEAAALAVVLPALRPALRVAGARAGAAAEPGTAEAARAWRRLEEAGIAGPDPAGAGHRLDRALARTLAVPLDPDVVLLAGGTTGAAPARRALLASAALRGCVLRGTARGVEVSAVAATALVPELVRVLAGPVQDGPREPCAAWDVRAWASSGAVPPTGDLLLHDGAGWWRAGPGGGEPARAGTPTTLAEVARTWAGWLAAAHGAAA